MKITFEGHNASGFVRYGGVVFPCGEAVTVKVGNSPGELPEAWAEKLANNPEFTVSEDAPAEKPVHKPKKAKKK